MSYYLLLPSIAAFAVGWFIVPILLKLMIYKPAKCQSRRRLDGKVVMVTGANTGLGKVTAADLAGRGAMVYMACRNMEKAEASRLDILRENPNAKLKLIKIDLGSLQSVKACADSFLEDEDTLDILVANAGFGAMHHALTEDDIEWHLGCNHLGHFYLTRLLLSSLGKAGTPSAKSRVIVVSSTAHRPCSSIEYDKLQDGKAMFAYGQSKLANMLFVKYLSLLLTDRNVTVNGLHPGVVNSEISRYLLPSPRLYSVLSYVFFPLMHFLLTPEEGSQTQIWAAVAEELEGVSGRYFRGCHFESTNKAAQSDEEAEKLWRWSCSKTRLPLDL